MNQFQALRRANTTRQVEWDGDEVLVGPLGALFKANELAGEVGELCNVVKKLVREALDIRGSQAMLIDLADEVGDVMICLDLLAAEYGIDLAYAVECKFNKTSEERGLRTRLTLRP